jgi:hypothetical protein
VRHFVDVCAKRMNKQVEHIPHEAMQVFLNYPWPGNVRELQNFIERSVILSPGNVLQPPLARTEAASRWPGCLRPKCRAKIKTLKDAEHEQILQALAETNWVIGGPKGAAARLGLQRTTLFYKMQKTWHLSRPSLKAAFEMPCLFQWQREFRGGFQRQPEIFRHVLEGKLRAVIVLAQVSDPLRSETPERAALGIQGAEINVVRNPGLPAQHETFAQGLGNSGNVEIHGELQRRGRTQRTDVQDCLRGV